MFPDPDDTEPALADRDEAGDDDSGNGVDGVRGVAMYRPPHFGQRPGSSPGPTEGDDAGRPDAGPPPALPPLFPRRGW